jgi:hypothetical protein
MGKERGKERGKEIGKEMGQHGNLANNQIECSMDSSTPIAVRHFLSC